MLRYVMFPLWWLYAEVYFIRYRIRTNILRKPDRLGTLQVICILDDEMMRDNRIPIIPPPAEYNVDENIRKLRKEFKKGNFRKRCFIL